MISIYTKLVTSKKVMCNSAIVKGTIYVMQRITARFRHLIKKSEHISLTYIS